MNSSQIGLLMNALPNSKCIETHISWVILMDEYAYKIKKPVKLSFLDFSTLQKRKHFCYRELELNRRLTSGVYLDVVQVRKLNGELDIFGDQGDIVEYAVKMRNLDEYCHMQYMLQNNLVTDTHIEQIADQISSFHIYADLVPGPADLQHYLDQFRDIIQVEHFLKIQQSNDISELFRRSIDLAERILYKLKVHIQNRYDLGFFVDGHGDLHSGNIFILDEPVLFDCIEFNDHFRYLDVLDEIAFFCLDMEYYERKDLETIFLDRYLKNYPVMQNDDDQLLFEYYKLYRCNVKLKVQSLKAMDADNTRELNFRLNRVNGYYRLYQQYVDQLSLKNF